MCLWFACFRRVWVMILLVEGTVFDVSSGPVFSVFVFRVVC